jgi:hypothetical protein
MESYGKLIPSQVEPIANIWNAQNAREAVEMIIDRLMEIEVPFAPDPGKPNIYKTEPLIKGAPPTVSFLMKQGRLNEKMLNNVASFFYTRPALKNFSQALLEMRGVDSQSSPEDVAEIAKRVEILVYNDFERKRLLKDYAALTAYDIGQLHKASTMINTYEAMKMSVSGLRVADFVQDIVSRSEPVTDAQRRAARRSA